ncbi:hypothetical protein [Mycoplasma parvum]|uniref:Uncharacterized protein n=1 Tax=Mycoplasma parvum str. Indiana TaxID=1403316 RepID=U5NCS2_9MOLU|nr:hypothetical protein [Mycoplasma parvum]AGX89135.1 hypothetical protein PRV_01985 [Mycoplasma parvum str. Indiana]
MGFFGSKETILNVGKEKVIVESSAITSFSDEKNPLKNLGKNKKFVIVGLCLNGEFRPEILLNWEKIQTNNGGSYTIRSNIRKALQEMDKMLRRKINKWIGCLSEDLVDENGEVGIGFLDQIFTVQGGGGSGQIIWELKNQKNSTKLTANYKNECKNLKKETIICKIKPQFVNENIKAEAKKLIEEKLEKAIENLVNRWLNKGIWDGKKLCVYPSGFKFKDDICLKSGEIGNDIKLKDDIKKLVKNLQKNGNINVEIGNYWLSGRWKSKDKEVWGQKKQNSNEQEVTWKLIEFAGSIGQLQEKPLNQAVKELVDEFENVISDRKKEFCGIWNKGISCPKGGLIYGQ